MHVEIWSDIACPWCYLGRHRFAAALATYEHADEVTVTWRAFELDPAAPRVRDVDAVTHLARKYGTTPEEARAMQARVAGAGAADGLELRPELARGGNTFDAHRLVRLGAQHGLQDAVLERLLRGYHAEGEPIGEPATLARLAREAGLPGDEVDELLAGDRFAAEVREDEATAARLGIGGVPFFVVDRAIGASGAHPPAALVELLEQARTGMMAAPRT